MKPQKFAIFNCQGLLNPVKKVNIADDFIHFNLTAMMLQETHIKTTGMFELKSSTGETLHLYNSGNEKKSSAGVGILVRPNNNKITFEPISDRICVIRTKANNITNNIISVYAPTSEITRKNPEETQRFYDTLTSVVNKVTRRQTIIIEGAFNAKTKMKSKEDELNKIVGKYAKNEMNENGEKLIEFCNAHNLRITNTFFKHKPIHQTTWTSPAPFKNIMDAQTKTLKRNPYRNQIDYIVVKNNNITKTFDSRAHTTNITNSDHKPVIANIQIQWVTKRHNYKNKKLKQQYKDLVTAELENENKIEDQQNISNQDLWNKTVNILNAAAEQTIGFKDKTKKADRDDIQQLSQMQREPKKQIEATNDETSKQILRIHKNRILTEIHNVLRQEENQKIRNSLKDLENIPDSNNQMFEAVKKLKQMKPREPNC